MSETEKQMLVSEVNLLRELRHPNIVRYHDRIIDRSSTTLYIVMEYCDGGDLASVIARCTRERCAAAAGGGRDPRGRGVACVHAVVDKGASSTDTTWKRALFSEC